jgi:hypothetical protein
MLVGRSQFNDLFFEPMCSQVGRKGHVQLFERKEQSFYVKGEQRNLTGDDFYRFKTAIPIPKGSVIHLYQR